MSTYYGGGEQDFSEFVDLMTKNELKIEDILDDNNAIRDLKSNNNSKLLPFISNEVMKKLIDYITKMPTNDDDKTGHKFPFNASEILCSNNMKIINKYFKDIEEENNDEEEEKVNEEKEDLLGYFFHFLDSESTDVNYVLVGYFNKIINHLLQNKSKELLKYVFIEHNVIFDKLCKHLNRRAIGETIKSLLTYVEENISELKEKKILLLKKMIEELNNTDDEEKYYCICETLINCINKKEFLTLLMLEQNFMDIIFSIIEKNMRKDRNLRILLNLMIKINNKILSLFENLVTPNLAAENEDLLNFDHDDDSDFNNEEILNKILPVLFNSIINTDLNFYNDLNEFDNSEIETTYEKNQKKLGLKKLTLIEYFRSLIDILVNTNAKKIFEKEIENIIDKINQKGIFWTLNDILFKYEFNNIFQTFYLQLMTIILNENSPENLVKSIFINTKNESIKLIPNLIKHIIDNIQFEYKSNRKANSCFLAIESRLLNDIMNSSNIYVKNLIYTENDFHVFHEVCITRLNNLFTQKLLYENNSFNFNDNDNENSNENYSQSTQSIKDIIEEDIKIYLIYKAGGNYKEYQDKKIARELEEKEKKNFHKNQLSMSQELVADDVDHNNDFNPYNDYDNQPNQENNEQKFTKGLIIEDDDLKDEKKENDNKMELEDLDVNNNDDFKIEENEDFKIEENDDDNDNENENVKLYREREKQRLLTEEDEDEDEYKHDNKKTIETEEKEFEEDEFEEEEKNINIRNPKIKEKEFKKEFNNKKSDEEENNQYFLDNRKDILYWYNINKLLDLTEAFEELNIIK